MNVSTISQQTYRASFHEAQVRMQTKRDSIDVVSQNTEIVAKTESVKITSGYDLTHMTSEDMLALAKSFYEDGYKQDFLSLAVFSGRATLADHPDPYVTKSWTTPRNEDGTFNLLAEIQATPKYSTGSSHLDKENKAGREHILHTLLTLPVRTTTIEWSTINITV